MLMPQTINYRWPCLFLPVLIISSLLTACSPTTVPTTEVVVQPPVSTPTFEPTFTPSPPPTNTPISTPTATPTPEPTPTPVPRAGLSGRILDQETNQPIADAQVNVNDRTTTTNDKGGYSLTGLEPGQYVLSVTHPNYDPGLSKIFTVVGGQDLLLDLALYAPDTSPYPKDPMLTNPLDPNGAPTKEDAERLARGQGLSGEVVSVEQTTLTGEYLVNYKIGDEIRAAVAKINHDVWELTDATGRKWWIIKVCGNLASPLPARAPIPTPEPRSLLPLAEVLVDGLSVRTCALEECAEVGTVQRGVQVEVFGCLTDGGWCEVGWSGGRGWCTGQSLRQLAVAEAVPVVEAVLPTPTLGAVAAGAGKIGFLSYRDDNYGIDIIGADGTGLTRLIYSRAAYGPPTWSPDSQQITFSRDGDIYIINADGSGLVRLTNHPSISEFRLPEWSPDGQRIAFTSSLDGGGIYTINIDGGGLTRLTNNHPWDTAFTWSPDGRRIAFHADFDRDSFSEIYVINADGSGQTQLTVGSQPAWSPDGQQIAFSAAPDGKNGDIYVINVEGSGLTRLTDHPAWDSSPDWSPDSLRIVFDSARDSGGIYVMNADGSGIRYLVDGSFPAWSR